MNAGMALELALDFDRPVQLTALGILLLFDIYIIVLLKRVARNVAEIAGVATAAPQIIVSEPTPAAAPAKFEPPIESATSAAAYAKFNKTRSAAIDGECPTRLAEAAEESLALFKQQVDAGWENAKVSKHSGGVRVRYRDSGTGQRTFRVDATFAGVTAEQVSDGLKYEHRAAWDPTMQTPCYLKSYAHGAHGVDLLGYSTAPAAGGLVSSRAFCDLRFTCRAQAGEETTNVISSAPPDDFAAGWFGLTDKGGQVRARNLPGNGVRLVGDGSRLGFTLVTTSQIGGQARHSRRASVHLPPRLSCACTPPLHSCPPLS